MKNIQKKIDKVISKNDTIDPQTLDALVDAMLALNAAKENGDRDAVREAKEAVRDAQETVRTADVLPAPDTDPMMTDPVMDADPMLPPPPDAFIPLPGDDGVTLDDPNAGFIPMPGDFIETDPTLVIDEPRDQITDQPQPEPEFMLM